MVNFHICFSSRMLIHHLGLLPSFPNLTYIMRSWCCRINRWDMMQLESLANMIRAWTACPSLRMEVWADSKLLKNPKKIQLFETRDFLEVRYICIHWQECILVVRNYPQKTGLFDNVCFISIPAHQCYDLIASAFLNQPEPSLVRRHFKA